jgi:hypothetical protein
MVILGIRIFMVTKPTEQLPEKPIHDSGACGSEEGQREEASAADERCEPTASLAVAELAKSFGVNAQRSR